MPVPNFHACLSGDSYVHTNHITWRVLCCVCVVVQTRADLSHQERQSFPSRYVLCSVTTCVINCHHYIEKAENPRLNFQFRVNCSFNVDCVTSGPVDLVSRVSVSSPYM